MSALLRALARVFMRACFPQVMHLPPAELSAWLADNSRYYSMCASRRNSP